ncbi:MAG: CapA family protein [Clostridia bacterium]|nr:CapA family protein [Clostridia bacterium]
MKRFGKRFIGLLLLIGLSGTLACAGDPVLPSDSPVAAKTPQAAEPVEEEIVIGAETTSATELPPAPETPFVPEETPAPSPAATPVPSPALVTIGAVGDIMIPSQIVLDAKTDSGAYDFGTLFAPFAELFQSVDLMCGNMETPLAGKEEGFSSRKDTKTGAYLFNAPDSVLDALKASGMDLLTTGNNHCLDFGAEGLYRTVETIRAAGFYQTGTFLNAEDREKPCIVEINGIRIGFVASTKKVNTNHSKKAVGDEEKQIAIGLLTEDEHLSAAVIKDIARVREAGAEFVIVFAHWDFESDNPTADSTKALAKELFIAGADCIIGAHPHRIKGAEYMTVQRADGPYTGLVLYSLGNFSVNNRFELMVGMFAKITLRKDFETGRVTLFDAGVLPTFTIRRAGKSQRFTVVPAYADPSRITGLRSPLTSAEIREIEKARKHAFKRLGKVEGLRILDEPEA